MGDVPARVGRHSQQQHNPPEHENSSHPSLVFGDPEFCWQQTRARSEQDVQPGNLGDTPEGGVRRRQRVISLAELGGDPGKHAKVKGRNHHHGDHGKVQKHDGVDFDHGLNKAINKIRDALKDYIDLLAAPSPCPKRHSTSSCTGGGFSSHTKVRSCSLFVVAHLHLSVLARLYCFKCRDN